MKKCSKCKQMLPESGFSKNRKRKDGLHSSCKVCHSKYLRQHYLSNKARYRFLVKNRRKEKKELYWREKANSKCCDCGAHYPNEPWLLEYDHVRDLKTEQLSSLIRSGSKADISLEKSKCDLVCILCHRRRTALRAGWKFNGESATESQAVF